MSIELERLNIQERNIELNRMSGVMVQILKNNGGVMDRQKLMLSTARALKVSINEMKLVLSFSKAEHKMVTDSNPALLTLITK